MADFRDEPVAVIGLGRFGSALAVELVSRGAEVLAVDRSSRITQGLAGKLPHLVTADTTDIEALREIGLPNFHRAVVAIGSDIQASILTTSLLVELEIADIWAKAINRQHGHILHRVGAHHVVLPEHEMGERVAHLLSGRILDYTQIDEGFAIIKTKPPRDVVGVPLRQSRVRTRHRVTVVAVKSAARGDGATFTYATPDTVLSYGDVILVLGTIDDVERFAEID